MCKNNAHIYFMSGVGVGNMVVVATIFNYRYSEETEIKKKNGLSIKWIKDILRDFLLMENGVSLKQGKWVEISNIFLTRKQWMICAYHSNKAELSVA